MELAVLVPVQNLEHHLRNPSPPLKCEMPRRRSFKACLNCRKRHLKCDEEIPACCRCRRANIQCTHSKNYEFRFINFDSVDRSSEFERQSASPHSPVQVNDEARKSTFVDETRSTIDAYSKQTDAWQDEPNLDSSHVAASENHISATPWEQQATQEGRRGLPGIQAPPPLESRAFNNPPAIVGYPLVANLQLSTPVDQSNMLYNLGLEETPPEVAKDTSTSVTDAVYPPAPPTWELSGEDDTPHTVHHSRESVLEQQLFSSFHTITHPREAYLVKFFTQTWGPIFDCLDADLTFTKTVVQIALTSSQPLLWAVLATSALQLSRSSEYPFAAAQYYRSRCSRSIMPILLKTAALEEHEEALFATHVMVRNYEHMTKNLSEMDPDTLFTAALAISANPSETILDKADLARAAFWVHLRQDIHMALLLQVPIRTDYLPCLQREKFLSALDQLTAPEATARQESVDCAWANRMASLLFDVINYAFNRKKREVTTWIALRSHLDRWSIAKPSTFQPYYELGRSHPDGRTFPEIWISSDCHVLAWLYFHTAAVLLKVYPPDPGVHEVASPVIGGVADSEEVLLHARAITAIVATNPNAQALIVFCHILHREDRTNRDYTTRASGPQSNWPSIQGNRRKPLQALGL